MCGILGIIDTTGSGMPGQLLDPLLRTMTARGPDGEGRFIENNIAMGMRRLAVIDVEGGAQPLMSGDGRVVAFQNGEIYNHADLRSDLEQRGIVFRTKSDTEVLAHGYAVWGIEGLLARLDGMYAVAILDRASKELHLARDRFGEKPLFYSAGGGRFAYSSNTTALALLPWVDTDIDIGSVDKYLALHYVPGRRTIFNGIHRVLPGERLSVRLQSLEMQSTRYYMPPFGAVEDVPLADLRRLLESAVSTRLVADVPVGIFLSGGIDSSLVAAIAAKHHPAIDTFSVGFKDARYDESKHAKVVAKAIGSSHHHFVFDECVFHELLPAVVEGLDEPIGDQALLPTYWLCREARKHVTVVLSGEGADELFGGYDYYARFLPDRRWLSTVKGWITDGETLSSPLRLCNNRGPITPSGFPLVMDPEGRRRLLGSVPDKPESWEEQICSTLGGVGNSLRRAALADLWTWLPDDLLVKLDRMAMVSSVEGRAPFLSPPLVEAALRLPSDRRMTSRRSKVALREVAASLLPRDIAERKKHGFVLPMARWLQQWLSRMGDLRTYFDLSRIKGFNVEAAVTLVQSEMVSGCRNERLLFSLVVLAEWHRSFFERVVAASKP
jgi:asparagine synthase (glutamine-hydrolysing)